MGNVYKKSTKNLLDNKKSKQNYKLVGAIVEITFAFSVGYHREILISNYIAI